MEEDDEISNQLGAYPLLGLRVVTEQKVGLSCFRRIRLARAKTLTHGAQSLTKQRQLIGWSKDFTRSSAHSNVFMRVDHVDTVCSVIWRVWMWRAGLLRHRRFLSNRDASATRTTRTMHLALPGYTGLVNSPTSGYRTRCMKPCRILFGRGERHRTKSAKPVSALAVFC
jgi:hypothetical protein